MTKGIKFFAITGIIGGCGLGLMPVLKEYSVVPLFIWAVSFGAMGVLIILDL